MRLELEETPINFQSHECVANAGVLFLLPFLKQSGLLSHNIIVVYVFAKDKKSGAVEVP
jgi:hypothetical protein